MATITKYNIPRSSNSGENNGSNSVASLGGGLGLNEIKESFLPAKPTDEEQTKYDVEVEGTFKKNVTLPSITLVNGSKTATISLDTNGNIIVDKALISYSDLVAYGANGTYVDTVISLIHQVLEEEGVSGGGDVNWGGITGTGNAVTNITYNTTTKQLSAVKGATFLTEHQSLDGYATEAWVEGKGYLTTHQDISGKADKSMSMMRRGYIASGDLDSYRDEAGTYGCDLNTVSNKPDGAYNWGDLIVTGWNNYTSAQIYIPDNDSGMYVRTYWNGGWRAWKQVALAKQLSSYLPLAGGTMSGGVNFTYNNTTNLSTLMIAYAASSTWSDGTNSHPNYGWDMRYHATGVYSSVLSSYFGMLFHTRSGTLCMTQAGNVGIGTTTPSVKLDVNGRIKTTASTGTTAGGGIEIGNCKLLQLSNSIMCFADEFRFAAKDAGWDWNQWAGLKYDHANKKIYLGLADASIFTANKAQTGGTVQLVNCGLVASGDVTAYSDKRLKSDIKDLEYRGPIEPKTYVKDGKKCIGFIAQEVREKYPELVQGEEKEDEYLSLNYGAITAVLASENKELRNEVTELKKRIENLETLINKLIEK